MLLRTIAADPTAMLPRVNAYTRLVALTGAARRAQARLDVAALGLEAARAKWTHSAREAALAETT